VQLGGVGPRIGAEHARRPAVGAQQPQQHPDRRGLAGAVRSEEAVDLALLDGEVEAVEGHGGAEGLAQASCLDDSGHDIKGTECSETSE
jgi:hypothetical protein